MPPARPRFSVMWHQSGRDAARAAAAAAPSSSSYSANADAAHDAVRESIVAPSYASSANDDSSV